MRAVKLGRKAMLGTPLAYHWAVSVGNTWYEIEGKGENKRNSVGTSHGFAAASSAGALGGELVGETDATDSEIDAWIEEWISRNPDYQPFLANCQKFAYEFMDWLTKGNFNVSHRFNAAHANLHLEERKGLKSFARAEDGNAIARYTTSEVRKSAGVVSLSGRSIHAQAQAVAGPGFGAWADASGFKLEAAYGNVVGAHIEPNLNTGAGIRNGNLDVHLAGFGGKIGADGIELNTPLGGVNACSMM
ncbi:Hypothetical predicted protein [Paramuricea clavata]|uniref:Uncharacterized protein n=1 Tax=Paramuricea clavata TaxID=317549 RepID=A0A6S7HW58_PARCT|nr:Hypothetical predicted protein [Paramuricea clavata]